MESSAELARRWREWRPSRESAALRWGLPWLEEALPAPQPGSLTVIGGRTGAGKSFFTLGLLRAASEHKPALYVSMEDGPLEVGRRLAAGLEAPGLSCAFPTSDRLSYVIDEIRAAGKAGIGLVGVDYLQACSYDGGVTAWSKADAVGRCVIEAKAEAREAGVALVLISQLRRPEATGGGPLPPVSMYALKESGTVENASEYVILLDERGGRVKASVAKSKGSATGAHQWYERGRGGVLTERVSEAAL